MQRGKNGQLSLTQKYILCDGRCPYRQEESRQCTRFWNGAKYECFSLLSQNESLHLLQTSLSLKSSWNKVGIPFHSYTMYIWEKQVLRGEKCKAEFNLLITVCFVAWLNVLFDRCGLLYCCVSCVWQDVPPSHWKHIIKKKRGVVAKGNGSHFNNRLGGSTCLQNNDVKR